MNANLYKTKLQYFFFKYFFYNIDNVKEQFNYIYLRDTCFTVAPVRNKVRVLYVEKSTSYLDLKCANTFRE
jgi:hypothetical protein